MKTVALQRCDQFVGRTMNWLYDHLRFVPRHTPIIFCDRLENREEFPELEAWACDRDGLSRRIWRKLNGESLFPGDSRRLRQYSPSVLHSHFGYVAVEDHPLQQALEVPWVIGFYGADVYVLGRQEEWRGFYADVFKKSSRILALGPVMREHLIEIGCPQEKVAIHPLGVDSSGLPSLPRILKNGDTLRVLFAGTFREKKGLRYALESAALALREGVRLELLVVGEASHKPGDRETKTEALQLIQELNIQKIVTFFPFLTFRELLDLALSSHVFVAPSVKAADGDAEGTPFVLQQMMATGMPVVATIHSDIPYVFGDLKDLLVPERDAKAIAERLVDYASSPDQLVAHGMSLRERIMHAFDVRSCAARLSDLYDNLLMKDAHDCSSDLL
ncbi:MAG: glycosyltransferase [Acidobacteria bacterium]|nr:glycosyltransferase [Acidobacteriota bacterium]MCI0718402.1 glycosyltransferase [Acidobacteriota bacterium]